MYNDEKHGVLAPEVYKYILNTGNRIAQTKYDLIEETKQLFPKEAVMITYPPEAEFLKTLVEISGAKKGIEIGVFTGLSSLCIAEGLPEDGKLLCFDISEEFTNLARKYWKISNVDHKINLTLGPALDSLQNLLQDESQLESYDFAYIDADKPNYINYYEILLKLLKRNGFIVFDNTLWNNQVVYEDKFNDKLTVAVRNLNQMLRDDQRVTINMMNIGDGITIVRKI